MLDCRDLFILKRPPLCKIISVVRSWQYTVLNIQLWIDRRAALINLSIVQRINRLSCNHNRTCWFHSVNTHLDYTLTKETVIDRIIFYQRGLSDCWKYLNYTTWVSLKDGISTSILALQQTTIVIGLRITSSSSTQGWNNLYTWPKGECAYSLRYQLFYFKNMFRYMPLWISWQTCNYRSANWRNISITNNLSRKCSSWQTSILVFEQIATLQWICCSYICNSFPFDNFILDQIVNQSVRSLKTVYEIFRNKLEFFISECKDNAGGDSEEINMKTAYK